MESHDWDRREKITISVFLAPPCVNVITRFYQSNKNVQRRPIYKRVFITFIRNIQESNAASFVHVLYRTICKLINAWMRFNSELTKKLNGN